MRKRLVFHILVSVLMVLFGAAVISDMVQENSIRLVDNFTTVSRYVFLMFALLIFLSMTMGWPLPIPQNKESGPARLANVWWVGFVAIVLTAIGLSIYVNPHARFAGRLFPPITPSARSIKTELYRQLKDNPDIVILGSSRAFTISPDYINAKTTFDAFNMSVEGGRVGDFEVQLDYILSSKYKPRVLLIEVAYPSFGGDYTNPDLQPLALIPYMPIDMAASVAETALRDTLSVQSLSDSIYILTLPNAQIRLQTWSFEEDGMGVRHPLTHEQYEKLLINTLPTWLNGLWCISLDPSAQERLERMIEIASANDLAVVLYESPMHSILYKTAQKKNSRRFDACRQVLTEYFTSLSRKHENVFFRDLSGHQEINNLGETGFYDAVHLQPVAAEMVVDALLPEIENALAWSLQQSAK